MEKDSTNLEKRGMK